MAACADKKRITMKNKCRALSTLKAGCDVISNKCMHKEKTQYIGPKGSLSVEEIQRISMPVAITYHSKENKNTLNWLYLMSLGYSIRLRDRETRYNTTKKKARCYERRRIVGVRSQKNIDPYKILIRKKNYKYDMPTYLSRLHTLENNQLREKMRKK